MACQKPTKAFYEYGKTVNGKKGVTFNPRNNITKGDTAHPIYLACGKCQSCIETKLRNWSIRCAHEISKPVPHWKTGKPDANVSCFLTLTYDNEHLPNAKFDSNGELLNGGHLNFDDIVKFHKRLRKAISTYNIKNGLPKDHYKYKYLQSGEYGSKTNRAHYHILIMGWDFPDKFSTGTNNNRPEYQSEMLTKAWPFGLVHLGQGTQQSAAYIAKYIGKELKELKDGITPDPTRPKPKVSASNGIGKHYPHTYADELLKNDNLVMNGFTLPIPDYYMRELQKIDPQRVEKLKEQRLLRMMKQTQEGGLSVDFDPEYPNAAALFNRELNMEKMEYTALVQQLTKATKACDYEAAQKVRAQLRELTTVTPAWSDEYIKPVLNADNYQPKEVKRFTHKPL